MTPSKYRSDTAREPFDAEISRHGPTSQIDVCAGQTVFARDLQPHPTPAGEFEMHFDL